MNLFHSTLGVSLLLAGGFAQSAIAQAPLNISVSFKRVINQDGTIPPAWTSAAIATMLADANTIFASGGAISCPD